ncbi:MAG: hypothetical protein JWP04_1491 [Belnapia sp.]|nr:hypothetical protein [Belnapia sp.]
METPVSAETTDRTLGRRVAVASLYAVLQRVVLRGLGIFSTLLLVRLLQPDDFGVVALAFAVYAVLDVLTATGFGMALVRMKDPQPAHYNTVFTLTILRGVVIALVVGVLAEWQARFMGEPRIGPVMWVVAASAFVQSFESVRVFDFERNLRFDRLLRYTLVSKVLALVISLPLAFWLQNYWALVLGIPLSRLVTIPYSYYLAPHRPRLTLEAWRELFGFSKWLMLGNLCTVADGQLMTFIVGRFQGMAAVGLYQVGFQIAALPITEIAAPIRPPIFAGFSRVWHDVEELRRQYMNGFELQWVLLVPLSIGLMLTSREVTLLFLGGEKWGSLATLMPLIALYSLFDNFGVFVQMIFIVTNRQRPMVIAYFVLILLRLVVVAYGAATHGIEGAAWALLGSAILNASVWQAMVGPLMNLKPSRVLRALWRGTLAALVMCAVVLLVPDDVGTGMLGAATWQVVFALLVKAGVGAPAYIGALLLFWALSGSPQQAAEAHLVRACQAALQRSLAGLMPRRRAL